MTFNEFVAAFSALTAAISAPRPLWGSRKPKNIYTAIAGYLRGTRGKQKHAATIKDMTLAECYELSYKLVEERQKCNKEELQ